eukprot:2246078-Pleurochrysis_carterae.AAC.4
MTAPLAAPAQPQPASYERFEMISTVTIYRLERSVTGTALIARQWRFVPAPVKLAYSCRDWNPSKLRQRSSEYQGCEESFLRIPMIGIAIVNHARLN